MKSFQAATKFCKFDQQNGHNCCVSQGTAWLNLTAEIFGSDLQSLMYKLRDNKQSLSGSGHAETIVVH